MADLDPTSGVELAPPGGGVDPSDRIALVELVNRVIDRGVVVSGELIVSVADVDLLYVGLRLVLASPDRLRPGRAPGSASPTPTSDSRPEGPPTTSTGSEA